MASEVLTGMARDWTTERLNELLKRELGDPGVLDEFCRLDEGRRIRANGPLLTFHVGAGTVPGVSVTSMIRALLVKSAVLLKPGMGDVVLPVLFAEALAEEAPELSDAMAVTYWPGGSSPLEGLALQRAEAVVAYGGDEAIESLRARTPVTARFIAYHHRLSVGLVGREALTTARAPRVARMAARAVSMFDQRGCVCPHAIYVEEGGAVDPGGWAALLASAMADLETELPGGYLTASEASAVHQARGSAEIREVTGSGVRVLRADESFWTVILEDEIGFTPSCLNRVVSLFPTPDLLRCCRFLGRGRALLTDRGGRRGRGSPTDVGGGALPGRRHTGYVVREGALATTLVAPRWRFSLRGIDTLDRLGGNRLASILPPALPHARSPSAVGRRRSLRHAR